jgi:MFS transporter, DHA1 family, multidrug resistance protein
VDRLEKRVFGTLFFSIFVTVTGVGIVVPLLPVYAHHLGAGGVAIGLIFGSFCMSRTMFLPYFGRLSDHKGRKPLIVSGLLGYALISALFLSFSGVASLIGIRFFQGIASAALMPVIQAYVGDIAPRGREGATLGWFNLAMFLGLGFGPLLGGAIQDTWGLRAAFAAMGVLALFGGLLAQVFLPPAASERIIRARKPLSSWKRLVSDREIISLFIFRFGYTFGIGIIWSFLPVLADAGHALSGAAIGSILMIGVILSGATQIPMGMLADRLDKRRLTGLGGVVACVGLGAIEWAESYAGLAAVIIVFGIGGGICMAAHMALGVRKGSRMNSMGSVMAILTSAHSIGMMAGALIAGVAMDVIGLRAVFPLGSAIMLLCTLIFFIISARDTETDARPN